MSELGLRKVLSNGEESERSKRSKTTEEVSDKSSDTDGASEGGTDDRLQRMSNAIRTVIEVGRIEEFVANVALS
jgi:hypothetical protein